MKHKYMLIVFSCLLWSGWAQAQTNFSDFAQGLVANESLPELQHQLEQPAEPQKESFTSDIITKEVEGAVEFTFHQPTFDFEVCVDGEFTIEDFNPTNSPSTCARGNNFNSSTAGVCWPAGSIAPGFTINAIGGGSPPLISVPTSAFFGNPSNAILINFPSAFFSLDITDPDVTAVSFEYYDQINVASGGGGFTYTINVYGQGLTLLGSTMFTGNGGTQFVGITAEEPISRIELIGPVVFGAFENMGNLRFGTCDSSPLTENVLGCEGSVEYDSAEETFELEATNCYYANPFNQDRITFGSTELCGDGEIVVELTGVDPFGWAGIMMRETLSLGSKKVALSRDNGWFARREARSMTNGPAYPQQFPAFGKNWLRLVRDGDFFRGFVSANGANWQQVMTSYIFMDDCIEVGLFLTNKQFSTQTITADFANLSISEAGSMALQQLPGASVAAPAHDLPVYPNPTTGPLTVELGDWADKDVQLDIRNTNGQIVQAHDLGEYGDRRFNLQLNDLKPGIYWLRIQAEGEAPITQRIAVQR